MGIIQLNSADRRPLWLLESKLSFSFGLFLIAAPPGQVVWSQPPERDEAGSPNTVGAVALAAAIRQLEQVGMAQVAAHEAELTAYALTRINRLAGITVYGDSNPDSAAERLEVIPINLDGIFITWRRQF